MRTNYFISLWFGIIMIALMAAGIFAFTFTGFMSDRLYGTKRFVFIILLAFYAIYRAYRLYSLVKSSRNEET